MLERHLDIGTAKRASLFISEFFIVSVCHLLYASRAIYERALAPAAASSSFRSIVDEADVMVDEAAVTLARGLLTF